MFRTSETVLDRGCHGRRLPRADFRALVIPYLVEPAIYPMKAPAASANDAACHRLSQWKRLLDGSFHVSSPARTVISVTNFVDSAQERRHAEGVMDVTQMQYVK